MIFALSLLFYTIINAIIYFLQPFGPVSLGYPTILGSLLFFFFGIVFLLIKLPKWTISSTQTKNRKYIILFLSGVIVVWLIYILKKYGYAPFIYTLLHRSVPPELLYGRYRELLPLKALFPPLVIAMLVTSILMFLNKKINILFLTWILIVGLLFIGVYDTRHIILWIFLYMILIKLPTVSSIIKILKNKYYILGFISIWIIFILYGNIRTGITFAGSRYFALSMAINEKYANLPMPIIWGIIYGFANPTRGMVNDGNLKLFDLSLPAKLFPGVFQKYVPPSNLFTTGQFSAQAFGFDAWHTYAIDFGILGACIFILWIFLIIFYLLKVLNRRLILRQSASGVYYALFLWLSLRVLLLPLGDYFLDLAAVMELLWLIILFLLTGIKVSSRIEVQGVSSS